MATQQSDPDLDMDMGVNFTEDLERLQQDEFVQAALNQGVDLKGYSKRIDQELREVEVESVKDYVLQSEKVVDLHNQMQTCDGILSRMQEMLLGFQADLGVISDEIKHLQSDSLSMNVKLRNRRAVEVNLKNFVDCLVLGPDLIETICQGEVNAEYVACVEELQAKLRYLNCEAEQGSLGLMPSETVAGRQVKPEFIKLRNKVVHKVRDYFMTKICELRNSKTNVQMVQKTALLKFDSLMAFLTEVAPNVAAEVRSTYMDSMGRTLHTLFKAYMTQLLKLELEVATRNDLIAMEESASKNTFSTKVDLSRRSDTFCLQTRGEILEKIEAEPVLVHVAQAEGVHLPYEVIFRSYVKHLMDAATNEYLFSMDFFEDKSFETFNQLFARTLSGSLESLENHLFTCWDAIGLILMIKIVHAQRMAMQRRRIPVLDSFFDRVNMLLWPRLKVVLDANHRSIELSSPKKLGVHTNNPHYVTRRYAEFSASILSLQGGMESLGIAGGGEEMLMNDMAKLRDALLELLTRMSDELPDSKQRLVFLINNYDQVLQVFSERQIVSEESAHMDELLNTHRGLFVEEELESCFGRLIGFVKQRESEHNSSSSSNPAPASSSSSTAQGGDEYTAVDKSGGRDAAAEAENLVRDFSSGWKSGIEAINQDILDYFSNFRNGMEILKQALTQLLLYYTRFQDILKKTWGRRPPHFFRDIVSTGTILVEIKKYSRSY
uniref:Vacuolar protein sorting-associated protein 52 homolog n=2 Tax=Octactis speculum TaxID=3111310 RepID=A0A7S2BKB8_9STRA|mmetsp:Transcript_24073/g.32916  ORF Transcript_24073/g.32916 Transcript_24073/m.32916 type:complete len:720 (+) Transcript_24073:75-2234(+)